MSWMLCCLSLAAIMVLLCQVDANCEDRIITINVSSSGSLAVPVVGQVVIQLHVYPTRIATFDVTTSDSSEMFEVTEMTDDTVTITNSSGIRGEIMVDIRTNRTSSGSNQDSHSTTSSGTGMIYSAVNVFQLNLTFVEDKTTCSNIIFSRDALEQPFIYQCVPISSCNSTSHEAIQSLIWRRRGVDNNTNTLVNSLSMSQDIIEIFTQNQSIVGSDTLNISSPSYNSSGFYEILGVDGAGNNMLLHSFILYFSPRWIRGSDLVDISTDNGERDVHLFCRFRTFPESIVTWQYAPEVKADPTDVNVSRVVFNDTLVQGSQPVVNGNITFIEVAYEDAGFYNCSADNGYNVTIVRLRLRVKNPIRVVFPIVGTIGSFIVTALFILGGYVVRKIIGEKEPDVEPVEYDVAFSRRPQSVASEEDDVQISKRSSNRRSLQPLVSKDSTLSTT